MELSEYIKHKRPNLAASSIVTYTSILRGLYFKVFKSRDIDFKKFDDTTAILSYWMKTDDIKKAFDTLAKHANFLYKKESLSTDDLQDIQNYIIVALVAGVFIPPRRSLDYTHFKIKEIDPKLNYFEKKTMVFNFYKTAKFYGKQVIDIPPALFKIIKKWLSINPTEWLLFDTKGQQLSPVKLNQRLNKVFGKGRSIKILSK